MPIFDDPRKSLENMQRQLLQEEEEYEEEYDGEFLTEEEWLDGELAEARAMLEEAEEEETEIPYRNFANGYGNDRPRMYDYDEEEEEDVAPVGKGPGGQLILTFVLLAAIAAVAIYWMAVLL